MFQSSCFVGETRRRYSGKLVAMGYSAKKLKPMKKVAVLTRSHMGTTAVKRVRADRRMRTRVVRCGTRHS
jgi:predicted class III extradiol MEMO1 family dioxygenase